MRRANGWRREVQAMTMDQAAKEKLIKAIAEAVISHADELTTLVGRSGSV